MFISPADININRYIEKTNTTLSKKGFESGRVLKGGSVLFVSIGSTIGKVAQTKEKSTSNQQINAIEVNENNNNNFIYSLLEKHSNNIKAGASTQAVPILNKTSFSLIELEMPKVNEQESIGILFERIDNLITLHQRKCEKLENIKKSLLEKMFPKNGDDKPQIRFKGFTDSWEQRKLGEIFHYERPDKYIVNSTKYLNIGKIPVLTANKAFILGYTNEEKTYDKKSIIFDDFTLDNKYVDFPYMVKSSAIKILTENDEKRDDLYFLFNRLNSIEIEVLGHARHYISIVQKKVVLTPEIDEQKQVGNLFSNLDNLITLHQRKLEKLQNIKKSLLEKMFV